MFKIIATLITHVFLSFLEYFTLCIFEIWLGSHCSDNKGSRCKCASIHADMSKYMRGTFVVGLFWFKIRKRKQSHFYSRYLIFRRIMYQLNWLCLKTCLIEILSNYFFCIDSLFVCDPIQWRLITISVKVQSPKNNLVVSYSVTNK